MAETKKERKIGGCIKKLRHEGYPEKQSIAIAERKAGNAKPKGKRK